MTPVNKHITCPRRFHDISTWNTSGVFLGMRIMFIKSNYVGIIIFKTPYKYKINVMILRLTGRNSFL